MIQKETETKNVEVIKDILCNKCGNSCKGQACDGFECAELRAHWGYGSKRDGEVHEAHLCEKCWEEISTIFKHSDLVAENIL